MRTLGTAALALALTTSIVGPALGGSTTPSPYPPSPTSPPPPAQVGGSVSVSDRTIDCGEDALTVRGSGWAPNQQVDIFFAGEQIGSANPDAQGNFSERLVPPSAPQGQHSLQAVQGTNQATASVTCVGDGAVGAAGAEGIAFTGANITVGLLLLIGLLLAGGVTLILGRRRARGTA